MKSYQTVSLNGAGMNKDTISLIQEKLQRFFSQAGQSSSAITGVYIFGSTVTGRAAVTSDVDLAFLLDEDTYKADPLAASAPCYLAATKVGMEFGKKTDITILNAASLEMAYEIVTSGLCLFAPDPEKRLEYEAALRGMYFDFKPFLDELRSNTLSHL
jgi:predicted nucleotidyltransferase